MKYFLLLITFCISVSSHAQQDTLVKPLSVFERFSNQPGTLFFVEDSVLDRTSNILIAGHRATNVSAGQSKYAISFGGAANTSWLTSDVIYIDAEEFDDVMKALEFFREVMRQPDPVTPKRYQLFTRNNVQVSFSFTPVGLGYGWSVSFTQFSKIDGIRMPGAAHYFRGRRIEDLMSAFQKAKALAGM